jgi:chemotaxis protein CheX
MRTWEGISDMQAKYMNPFLSSSIVVLETLIQVKPSLGELKVKVLEKFNDQIWLKIGIVGGMTGDIIFGFPEQVALKIASGMMGGYMQLTKFDEMCQSAISELGNMISGNASTILYNDGIVVDITPPSFVNDPGPFPQKRKAITMPLRLENIGEFEISILI